MRLTTDLIAYTVQNIPRWTPINICSYHLQEAGATPVQEIAYALSTAIAVLDAYTSSTLHDLQLLDGYCSAALLVDRARGLGAVSVTFDSRTHLEDSRPRAEEIRRTGLAKAGAEVSEVREAEIVIAGLRLPQTG
jgi:methylmalonyl-CoA mutase N-terminal domain/subunit